MAEAKKEVAPKDVALEEDDAFEEFQAHGEGAGWAAALIGGAVGPGWPRRGGAACACARFIDAARAAVAVVRSCCTS